MDQVKSTVTKRSGVKDKEKFEKRILEELNKIFTETDSFFFCQSGDITNSLQRLCFKEAEKNKEDKNQPLWKNVDDRFFWNKHMLLDIFNLKVFMINFLITHSVNFVLITFYFHEILFLIKILKFLIIL